MIRRWLAALMVEAFQRELEAARQAGYSDGIEVGYTRGLEESVDSVVAAVGYRRGAALRGAKDSFRHLMLDHEFMK